MMNQKMFSKFQKLVITISNLRIVLDKTFLFLYNARKFHVFNKSAKFFKREVFFQKKGFISIISIKIFFAFKCNFIFELLRVFLKEKKF